MLSDILDVYAGSSVAGVLARSDMEPDTTLFSYRDGCIRGSGISLTMPIMRDSYDSMGGLLPIFDMNLPEGALREELRKNFSKTIRDFDDLALLSIVGHSQIGRLRFVQAGAEASNVETIDLDAMLTVRGTKALFDDLLRRYAESSGVSGAQPKVLLRGASDVTAATQFDRLTQKGTTHLVKAFDNRQYPELAANEYFCMRAARHAGLPTPNMRLSDDRQILIVDRFDLAADGSYSGFEDFCVLRGVRSYGKYDASYENLAAGIRQFVSSQHQVVALEQLFLNVALSCVVRNGDAHLKNFGVIYEDCTKTVKFAPAYDITSTVPYLPKDTLALSLDGSKEFPDVQRMTSFGRLHCGLSAARARGLLGQVREGVMVAIKEMSDYTREHKDFTEMADTLTRVFNVGMEANMPKLPAFTASSDQTPSLS